jgi:outer membrane protein
MKIALSNNLDIGIAQTRVQKSHSNYLGSIGKFLPDITTGYSYNYLKGDLNMPFGQSGPTKLDTPFIIASAGFKYHGYRGGSIVFGALQHRNLYRAAKHAKTTSINDILLESARRYYRLVEAEAVMQIQIRAVDISTEQLDISKNLKLAGSATALDVFQSQTQLSQDKQDLINQQIERRRASIALSELLNLDQATDISPEDSHIRKIRLIDDRNINKLLSLAVLHRPELKELKERSLAARKSIMVASASLQPSLTFSGTAYGIGKSANNLSNLNSLALGINWTLNSLGTSSISEMRTAQCDFKETKLQLKKTFNTVSKEVRNAFLEVARAERDLEESSNQVASSAEELRVAKLRYENGLVKKIDVLKAQNDFTKSLIKKARAIVNFNIAQVELLHNVGMINSDYLLATKPVPII